MANTLRYGLAIFLRSIGYSGKLGDSGTRNILACINSKAVRGPVLSNQEDTMMQWGRRRVDPTVFTLIVLWMLIAAAADIAVLYAIVWLMVR
jgi:hypothetical protein